MRFLRSIQVEITLELRCRVVYLCYLLVEIALVLRHCELVGLSVVRSNSCSEESSSSVSHCPWCGDKLFLFKEIVKVEMAADIAIKEQEVKLEKFEEFWSLSSVVRGQEVVQSHTVHGVVTSYFCSKK